jgi:septal ring factor EnvC (AmiA/AmiB activator)
MARKKKKDILNEASDNIIKWVGSTNSLIIHTAVFVLSFVSPFIFKVSFDLVLLVLTTLVSLEAIYLAIFIQRSVNQQANRLEDVEDALDDVEESLDDVEESIDDVEESLSKKNVAAKSNSEKRLEKSLEEIIQELKTLKDHLKV